jgi:orotidine-5'-phosphate decarboxylase
MKAAHKTLCKPTGKARVLVALDVPSLLEAETIAAELKDEIGGFKVGLELLTEEGSRRVVEVIRQFERPLFFDGKFNDIPNTCGRAAAAVSRLGVWMFNVHASAGAAALRQCAQKKGDSLVVAVTVLTSLKDDEVSDLFGASAGQKVLQLAQLAARNWMDGVVCAPTDLAAIRADGETGNLLTVVPGIRPTWAATGDQVRIATPSGAVAAGADYLVVGRPILEPPSSVGSRKAAARMIVEEIEQAERGLAQ